MKAMPASALIQLTSLFAKYFGTYVPSTIARRKTSAPPPPFAITDGKLGFGACATAVKSSTLAAAPMVAPTRMIASTTPKEGKSFALAWLSLIAM